MPQVYNVAISGERDAIEAVKRTLPDTKEVIVKVKGELFERIYNALKMKPGDVLLGASGVRSRRGLRLQHQLEHRQPDGEHDAAGDHTDNDPGPDVIGVRRVIMNKLGPPGTSSRLLPVKIGIKHCLSGQWRHAPVVKRPVGDLTTSTEAPHSVCGCGPPNRDHPMCRH